MADLLSTPGCSWEEMTALVYSNLPLNRPPDITPELVISICWEESLFNNIEQPAGTAWGFGQVEPLEFWRLEQQKNSPPPVMPVYNLPPRNYFQVGDIKKARLLGKLTSYQSIQVCFGMLLDLYARNHSRKGALHGYAGVGYKGKDVPAHLNSASKRIKVIDSWEHCEQELLKKTYAPTEDPYPKWIMSCLKMARSFNQDEAFEDILFPKNYVDADGKRKWQPQILVAVAQLVAAT